MYIPISNDLVKLFSFKMSTGNVPTPNPPSAIDIYYRQLIWVLVRDSVRNDKTLKKKEREITALRSKVEELEKSIKDNVFVLIEEP